MICINCNAEFKSKRADARFCSSKCRTAYSRKTLSVTKSVTDKSDVTDNVTDNKINKLSVTAGFKLIPDVKVYGRPAAQYNIAELWRLRPEPENKDDKPILNNRGRYQRQDKSKYQIDSTGSIHGLTGNQVYQDIGLNLQV